VPTVVLHQFGPTAGLPSFSPFCWKVQMALRARGVEHVIQNAIFAKRSNPRGKLPWLVWDGEGIEDSSAIVRAIDERAGPGPRLIPSDAKERAEAHILEDWADESLYFHGMYAKFADPDGWAHTKGPFAAMMPAAVRPLGPWVARRESLAKLR
jgi:glutathione S-transferase